MSAPAPVTNSSSVISCMKTEFDSPSSKIPETVTNQLNQLAVSSSAPLNLANISKITLPHHKTLSTFVDFSTPHTFQALLPANLKESVPHCFSFVQTVLRVYQTGSRKIGSSGVMYEYSMNPEIMAYMMTMISQMTSCKIGATVVELAAGTGENGIVTAFAGAREVIINDIELTEAGRFGGLKETLPEDIKSKLTFDTGDCLDILKRNPKLKGTASFVLARNIMHFMYGLNLSAFMQTLMDLLEPGGQAIITVNGVYEFPAQRKIFEENPNTDLFELTYCEYINRDIGQPNYIYRDFTPITEQVANLSSHIPNTIHIVCERKPGSAWKANAEAVKLIPGPHKDKVLAAYKAHQKSLAKITNGVVKVVTRHVGRYYNTHTLPKIFSANGFNVLHTFVTDNLGHLITTGELFRGNGLIRDINDSSQVGVIVQKPLK